MKPRVKITNKGQVLVTVPYKHGEVTWALAPHTKLFFPTVSDAAVLASLHADAETVQVLTGHCMLNHHSAKIKKRVIRRLGVWADDKIVHYFLSIVTFINAPS